MTTKTQAAKAFAEKYGTFDGSQYTIRSYPARIDIGHSFSDKEAKGWRDLAIKTEEARNEDLRLVMALLGVEDQYEDTVETQKTPVGQRYIGRTYGLYGAPVPDYETVYEDREVVTQTGVSKFATDLRAAQSAIDGAAALKRLRKAVKSVQKESDK